MPSYILPLVAAGKVQMNFISLLPTQLSLFGSHVILYRSYFIDVDFYMPCQLMEEHFASG